MTVVNYTVIMNPSTPLTTCIPRDIQLKAAVDRLQTMSEEVANGYEIIARHKKTVTIFGSARTLADDFYYKKAYEMGKLLAENHYAVVTGGGNGIMAAANQGAHDGGGASIGFNITLPHEQTLNPYATESYAFSHFAPRKVVMTLFAHAYVYFPGGFGTLDELTEILTLTQTGKMTKAPIILFNSSFWKDFDSFIKKHMLDTNSLISEGDEQLYTITDDLNEAIKVINDNKTYCDDEDQIVEAIAATQQI